MSDWGRKKAKDRYADGGAVSGTAMSRRSIDDPGVKEDFKRQKYDAERRLISPTASQVFSSGRVGPMNITPKALKMEPDEKKRGGAVKKGKK